MRIGITLLRNVDNIIRRRTSVYEAYNTYLEILERFMVRYIQVAILWLTKYNVKFSVRIIDWARPNELIYVYVVSKLHRSTKL